MFSIGLYINEQITLVKTYLALHCLDKHLLDFANKVKYSGFNE